MTAIPLWHYAYPDEAIEQQQRAVRRFPKRWDTLEPHQWVYDALGVELWSIQRDILNSAFNNRYTAVRSCHAAGKTFIAAVTFLAFMNLQRPCKIITTAPTGYQVKDLLWSEINTLYASAKTRLPGECLQTRYKVSADHFGVGISPKESVNFQGYHSDNILVILDEAPGVRKDTIEGAESLMSAGNVHWLSIGNPTENSGHFFEAFSRENWHTFHIPYDATPNFTGESVPNAVRTRLISKEWVEERRGVWSEDDPRWQSRVLANFPELTEDQLIPLSVVEAAERRHNPIERDHKERGFKPGILSIDVARFGDDRTVYSSIFGEQVDWQRHESKKDTMHIAGNAKRLFDTGLYEHVRVDDVGVGGGVTDRLREMGVNVRPINAGNRAREAKDYFNLRSEMWWKARDWLKGGAIPTNGRLRQDLIAPRYTYNSKGQIVIEPKEKIKERIGASTDYGDSFVQGVMPLGGLTRMRSVRGV